jgi:hypothetical protein
MDKANFLLFLSIIFLIGLGSRSLSMGIGRFYEGDVYIYMAQIEHCIQSNSYDIFHIYYEENASYSEKPLYILLPYLVARIIPSPYSIYFLNILLYTISFVLIYLIFQNYEKPKRNLLISLLLFAIYPIFQNKAEINNWRGETIFDPILILLAYLLLKWNSFLAIFLVSVFALLSWNGATYLFPAFFYTLFFYYIFPKNKKEYLIFLGLFLFLTFDFGYLLYATQNPFSDFLHSISQIGILETSKMSFSDFIYYLSPSLFIIPFGLFFVGEKIEEFSKFEANKRYLSFIFANFLVNIPLVYFQLRWVSILKVPLLLFLPFAIEKIFEKKFNLLIFIILLAPSLLYQQFTIKNEFWDALALIKNRSRVLCNNWGFGGYIEYFAHSFPYTDSGPLQSIDRIKQTDSFFEGDTCNFSMFNITFDYILLINSTYPQNSCFYKLANNQINPFIVIFKSKDIILLRKLG